ncbi:hypothetical protein LEMLEM_LOCUS10584 [Lemmus lemmus]
MEGCGCERHPGGSEGPVPRSTGCLEKQDARLGKGARPGCKRQLAQGAKAKLQLALIRAGAVTPPALPAPSPPLDRPRGRGRGTGFTVGMLIGEGAGPTVDGVPTRDYVSGFRLRTEAPAGLSSRRLLLVPRILSIPASPVDIYGSRYLDL